MQSMTPHPLHQVPLTPVPDRLTVWRASTPWQTVRSMLGLVIVCFFIAQFAVVVVAGFIDGDMNGTLGPLDPLLTFFGGVCLSPFLLLFFYLRRPNLTHTVQAYPAEQGRVMHALAGGMVVKSPQPTTVQHHLFRSTAPLEMPKPAHLWLLFVLGVGVSTACLLPLTVFGATVLTVLLAVAVVLPAWLIGFSTPVFAWWSITSRHFGIHISRRDAEWMLVAGMLSAVPAIVINSLFSPILVGAVGLNAFETGTLGEGLILFVSAPVGEELSKALAVIALSHLIVSPKHGFYVGTTVGLGFALLENASYILMALAGDYSSIAYFFTASLRGLSSIPGHAMWTGLSGYAIGCWLSRGNALLLVGHGLPLGRRRSGVGAVRQTGPRRGPVDVEHPPVSSHREAPRPASTPCVAHANHPWRRSGTRHSRSCALERLIVGVGMALADSETLLALVLQLAWLAVMVLGLWFCILRWLPTILLNTTE